MTVRWSALAGLLREREKKAARRTGRSRSRALPRTLFYQAAPAGGRRGPALGGGGNRRTTSRVHVFRESGGGSADSPTARTATLPPPARAGDNGYSYPRIRRWLRQHRIEAVIPQRSDQRRNHRRRPLKFDRQAYRPRKVVERCVGWMKEYRRVALRYEKLATNYLGMLKLAMIQRGMASAFPNRN